MTDQNYIPLTVPAAATTTIRSSKIRGLFCTGAGTFTINRISEQGATVQVVAFTGTANTWYDLPFWLGGNGGTIVTGAGATGVLAT